MGAQELHNNVCTMHFEIVNLILVRRAMYIFVTQNRETANKWSIIDLRNGIYSEINEKIK